MIVWVKAAAVNCNCDQKAEILTTNLNTIHVKLLGDDKEAIVFPEEICGLQFSQNLSIKFKVEKTQLTEYHAHNR